MRSVTYDSDYQHYARLGTDGVISVRTIPGDREIKRLKSAPSTRPGAAWGQLSFSPDDRCIARIAESGKLEIWQWESGASILKSPPENCSGARAFSRDNRWFVAGHDNWITCFDLTTGEPIRRWRVRGRPYSIGFHPDNRTVAVSYFDASMVSIYHAEDGGHVADLPTGAGSMAIVAWHPEGNLLATAGSDPRIQIWDVPAQRKVAVLEGHVQLVNFLMFDGRGEMLASMGGDNVLRLWQPMPSRLLMKLTPRWVDPSRAGRWAGVVPKVNDMAQLWGFIPSREYRTFLNTFSEGECELREGAISADGSMLALGASDGVRLWDVAACREIARLSMGDTTCVMFRNNDRELLTCGHVDGLRRWGLVSNTGLEGGLRLGPFRQIKLSFAPIRMARGRDEGTLAVVGERAGQCAILDLATESPRGSKMTHTMTGFVGLSPDGKRLATGGWHSERVKLWDASAGTLMKDLEVALTSRVFFTPDNRELIVARDNEFTFHTLDSLAVSRRLPRELGLYAGHVAFTADGKMMAMEMAPGVIHLKDAASGRTVAKLEDPFGDRSTWMSFTPDGTQLIVAARYAGAIHRWDLRAIRERLETMNLDWDWPALPAVEPDAASRVSERLRIQIIMRE